MAPAIMMSAERKIDHIHIHAQKHDIHIYASLRCPGQQQHLLLQAERRQLLAVVATVAATTMVIVASAVLAQIMLLAIRDLSGNTWQLESTRAHQLWWVLFAAAGYCEFALLGSSCGCRRLSTLF